MSALWCRFAPAREFINAEAGAYLGSKADRVVIAGPEILLEPQAFTTVARWWSTR
jgi:hypothetical protein